MTRRKRKWLIIVSSLGLLWLSCSAIPPWRFKRTMDAQLSDADTLIIDLNVFPPGTQMHDEYESMPAVRIEGTSHVRDFLAQLRFRTQFIPLYGHCRCIGEQAFRFERNGKELGVLTFHHHQSLRWRGFDTGLTNYDLTPSSIAQLDSWLDRTAGPALKDAAARADRISDEMRKSQWDTQPAASQPSAETR